jgi:hypothetical protein
MGVGYNARRTQPRYKRTLRAFIDPVRPCPPPAQLPKPYSTTAKRG